jgi:proteasome lid subunit RPN8/RPN11
MTLQNALESAKSHARECYPEESCGLIVAGVYEPCVNIAAPKADHTGQPSCNCTLCTFRIDPKVALKHAGKIDMVVHSHPDGPLWPSETDTQQQQASGYAWGMIALDEDRISDAVVWGGNTPPAPVIGRSFLHFISDCYTLIKDVYALGHDALAEQGVDWPFEPIMLPDFIREDSWWETDADLYDQNPFEIGFREIREDEARPGDVFLLSIRSEKMNHAGLLLENDLILHHLPGRPSRREPVGIWARQVKRWLRYEGKPNA